jgi:hypothetical protein
MEVQLLTFFTSALSGSDWSAPRPNEPASSVTEADETYQTARSHNDVKTKE